MAQKEITVPLETIWGPVDIGAAYANDIVACGTENYLPSVKDSVLSILREEYDNYLTEGQYSNVYTAAVLLRLIKRVEGL